MIIFDCPLASNSSDTVHISFVQVAMNSGDNQGPDRDVRERIVNLMQSIGKGPKKQIPAEELQKLERSQPPRSDVESCCERRSASIKERGGEARPVAVRHPRGKRRHQQPQAQRKFWNLRCM